MWREEIWAKDAVKVDLKDGVRRCWFVWLRISTSGATYKHINKSSGFIWGRGLVSFIFFLLGDSLASEFYVPTFQIILFHLHRSGRQEESRILLFHTTYEDGTECSGMLAYKIQMPGNHPKERIRHSLHSKSLKSSTVSVSAAWR
jgi:hypothetical protein